MTDRGNRERFTRGVQTFVPRQRSIVATPQFWIYMFGAVILALVVASQFGWAPKGSTAASTHPDLNDVDRPAPAVTAEAERSRTVARPLTQPAPITGAVNPVTGEEQPLEARRLTVKPSTPVRTFDPPVAAEVPPPSPNMPHPAQAPAVADHPAAPQTVAPAVHPDVKPSEPPPAAPVKDTQPAPASDSQPSQPPAQVQ